MTEQSPSFHKLSRVAVSALLFALSAVALSIFLSLGEDKPESKGGGTAVPEPVVKMSDEAWQKRLSALQYQVARRAGTERPFGEAYKEFENQGEGTYYCVCCGAELFTSSEKFHSGCGWPSFYDASKAKNVVERRDFSAGMTRVETLCKRCGAHLGHVFEGEGYQTPTDRRFCINAASLTFVPKGGKAPELIAPNSPEAEKKKAEVEPKTLAPKTEGKKD